MRSRDTAVGWMLTAMFVLVAGVAIVQSALKMSQKREVNLISSGEYQKALDEELAKASGAERCLKVLVQEERYLCNVRPIVQGWVQSYGVELSQRRPEFAAMMVREKAKSSELVPGNGLSTASAANLREKADAMSLGVNHENAVRSVSDVANRAMQVGPLDSAGLIADAVSAVLVSDLIDLFNQCKAAKREQVLMRVSEPTAARAEREAFRIKSQCLNTAAQSVAAKYPTETPGV